MKYEKPLIVIQDECAEGVYAASGDCWTIDVTSVQDWNGYANVFEVHIVHANLQHISASSKVMLTFNYPILSAVAQEYDCVVGGNTVTITRSRLGNAYGSGDQATYKVEVSTGDEATTRALAIISKTIYCDKMANVQGGGANE